MLNVKWDQRFLRLARLVSTWSKDPSTQTGAVIVDPRRRVVSLGYNGFPQGMADYKENYENREEKYSRIVHCEVNAVLFARGGIPESSTLYTWPFLSCDRCVVLCLQAGIKRFVAPQATAEQLVRWGTAFDRTRQYITDVGGSYKEYQLSDILKEEERDAARIAK